MFGRNKDIEIKFLNSLLERSYGVVDRWRALAEKQTHTIVCREFKIKQLENKVKDLEETVEAQKASNTLSSLTYENEKKAINEMYICKCNECEELKKEVEIVNDMLNDANKELDDFQKLLYIPTPSVEDVKDACRKQCVDFFLKTGCFASNEKELVIEKEECTPLDCEINYDKEGGITSVKFTEQVLMSPHFDEILQKVKK